MEVEGGGSGLRELGRGGSPGAVTYNLPKTIKRRKKKKKDKGLESQFQKKGKKNLERNIPV